MKGALCVVRDRLYSNDGLLSDLVKSRLKGAGWIWVEVAVLRRIPPPGTTCPPLWTTAGKFSGGRREMVGSVGPTRRVGGTSSRMPDALPDLIDHTGPSRPLNIHTSCTLLEKSINNRRLGDRARPLHLCFAFLFSLRLVLATHRTSDATYNGRGRDKKGVAGERMPGPSCGPQGLGAQVEPRARRKAVTKRHQGDPRYRYASRPTASPFGVMVCFETNSRQPRSTRTTTDYAISSPARSRMSPPRSARRRNPYRRP